MNPFMLTPDSFLKASRGLIKIPEVNEILNFIDADCEISTSSFPASVAVKFLNDPLLRSSYLDMESEKGEISCTARQFWDNLTEIEPLLRLYSVFITAPGVVDAPTIQFNPVYYSLLLGKNSLFQSFLQTQMDVIVKEIYNYVVNKMVSIDDFLQMQAEIEPADSLFALESLDGETFSPEVLVVLTDGRIAEGRFVLTDSSFLLSEIIQAYNATIDYDPSTDPNGDVLEDNIHAAQSLTFEFSKSAKSVYASLFGDGQEESDDFFVFQRISHIVASADGSNPIDPENLLDIFPDKEYRIPHELMLFIIALVASFI